MSDDLIENMRGRAAKCRRLAASMTDDQTIETLRTMAAEIDADIVRLEALRERPVNELPSTGRR